MIHDCTIVVSPQCFWFIVQQGLCSSTSSRMNISDRDAVSVFRPSSDTHTLKSVDLLVKKHKHTARKITMVGIPGAFQCKCTNVTGLCVFATFRQHFSTHIAACHTKKINRAARITRFVVQGEFTMAKTVIAAVIVFTVRQATIRVLALQVYCIDCERLLVSLRMRNSVFQ